MSIRGSTELFVVGVGGVLNFSGLQSGTREES